LVFEQRQAAAKKAIADLRMLLQLQERGCAEQLVFEQCQAAAKKAIADLRMLLRL
jgi:multidrug resistance efflux pump